MKQPVASILFFICFAAFLSAWAGAEDLVCTAHRFTPDETCTPGAVLPFALPAELCQPGYKQKNADIPEALRKKVYDRYGVLYASKDYAPDYLVPPELGGVIDDRNLWPQPTKESPGFHEKNELEDFLYEAVCAGRMDLRAAQAKLTGDWVRAHDEMRSLKAIKKSATVYEIPPEF
ncbi:MAG: hypothetical protein HQL19_06015 [Candidatus Omnitrophica bacterium]|nr:hypothetical protein [Candidatus Omnitrophota bacterium]